MAETRVRTTKKKPATPEDTEVKTDSTERGRSVRSVVRGKVSGKQGSLAIPVYNNKGEAVGTVSLPKEIFGQKANDKLLSQAVRVFSANQKRELSSTKTRGEVSGGGRKPWRQKGTGRARAGSIRAPQWRGGGVVFGPHPKDTRLELPKKMRRKALALALSSKFSAKTLFVIDKLDIKEPKTKQAASILERLPVKERRSLLLILDSESPDTTKSFRNLENVDLAQAVDLNMLAVLKSSSLIFTAGSLEKLKERLLKTESKEK